MDNLEKNNPNPIPQSFSALPHYVHQWLFSPEAADNNAALAAKFNLTGKNSLLAKATGQIILKPFA
ncbi:MAG: hypothetical protein AAB724_03155, partial [Patescibacteria group bacterium]